MPEITKTNGNGSRTILVVEDSPTQAYHLKALLESYDLNVVIAEDGLMGLELARELYPALVVLDVKLPKMNGFQVCQQLKGSRDTVDIPVVILTRHDEKETFLAWSKQLWGVDYIVKDNLADVILLEMLQQMGLIDR